MSSTGHALGDNGDSLTVFCGRRKSSNLNARAGRESQGAEGCGSMREFGR